MVDTLRCLPWTDPPAELPEGEGARRKPGPIYDLAAVQRIVDGDHIYLATENCSQDVEKLEWDVDDVAQLIADLLPGDYRNSEWCRSSRGHVSDADVYRLDYDTAAMCRGVPWKHKRLYLKFGARHNDPRLTIWVFSCHPPRLS